MKPKFIQSCRFFILIVLCNTQGILQKAVAQEAQVREHQQIITTYPFGNPDPFPALARDGRHKIYPYFKYDGYSVTSEEKEWTVVDLENDYIKVSILPEVGGKIWGAVEKETNKEFIYLNDVLKFRNIAMRGPWTSGGIEFNFGIVGHAPSTATPVDYVFYKNPDGSVSCVVGVLDLPSRTEWRVNITLPKDKAYFETKSLWYNPTPLNASYYQWMNAAIKASDDLQFFFPGENYIGHSGDAHPWPITNEGLDISQYKNNNFGGSKSYHVLGKYANHSGAYFHDEDFGYGHWSQYDDMAGQKIWIWSLARSGGIWEDLLTDNDGQYVEVQSGRLFSQASGSSIKTPFNQVNFGPMTSDQWSELWFPVKETGGIAEASPYGTLNVTAEDGKLKVALNALQDINDNITVTIAGNKIFEEALSLTPMQVYKKEIALPSSKGDIKVNVGNLISYNSDPDHNKIKRPMVSPEGTQENSSELAFQDADDEYKSRNYAIALEKFNKVLEKDPAHSLAKIRIAEIFYQRGQFDKGLRYASEVLAHDTYHPYANFMFGVLNRAKGDLTNAKEALSWAARSMEFRSAAYAQLAGINLQENNFSQAKEYALRALDYNKYNIYAYMALAISHRKLQENGEADKVLAQLLDIDPLNHFARFEQYLLTTAAEKLDVFKRMIRNELPHESYLELAMHYVNAGLSEEAIQVLKESPDHPIASYWLAYLHKDHSPQESKKYLTQSHRQSPKLVFPFRMETIPVLEWAEQSDNAWQTKYYLGLIYWGNDRQEEARRLFREAGDEPDFAPFYLTRGKMMKDQVSSDEVVKDFKKAIEVNQNEYRTWHTLFSYYDEQGSAEKSLELIEEAYKKFPDNYVIGMDYSKALLNNKEYQASLDLLNNLMILPYEGAREGHHIYELASIFLAMENLRKGNYNAAIQELERSKEWPENLGVGKPYDTDVRLQNYLAAHAYRQLGNKEKADQLIAEVYNYTKEKKNERNGGNRYIGALVLNQFGDRQQALSLLPNGKMNNKSEELLYSLVMAKINNNKKGIRGLEKRIRTEELGRDNSIVMALNAITLTGNSNL